MINANIRVVLSVYSDLVGMFVCPAIDTIIGSIQATFGEPYDITVLEAPGTNGPEWTVPIQSLFCGLKIAADSVSVSREVESIAEKRTEADCQCGRGTSDAWSLMAISDMAIPVGRTPHFQYAFKGRL